MAWHLSHNLTILSPYIKGKSWKKKQNSTEEVEILLRCAKHRKMRCSPPSPPSPSRYPGVSEVSQLNSRRLASLASPGRAPAAREPARAGEGLGPHAGACVCAETAGHAGRPGLAPRRPQATATLDRKKAQDSETETRWEGEAHLSRRSSPSRSRALPSVFSRGSRGMGALAAPCADPEPPLLREGYL